MISGTLYISSQGKRPRRIEISNFTCNPDGIGRSQFTPDVLKNQIDVAFTGIYTENSGILINNNIITHVEDVGIHAISTNFTQPLIETRHPNRIQFSDNYGILVTGLGTGVGYDALLSGNEVRNTNNSGIKVQFCQNKNTIDISANQMRDNWQGVIWAADNPTATITISGNDIQNNPAVQWSTPGIMVTEMKGTHSPTVFISNNNPVSNTWGGIYMAFLENPIVTNNQISLSSYVNPLGVRAGGIYGEHTSYAEISNNSITTLNPALYTEMIGVGVDFGEYCRIHDNYISEVESGIWIGGYSAKTRYYCNVLENNNRGVLYNFATVGDQGYNTQAADNYWRYVGGFTPFADTYMYFTDGQLWNFYVRKNQAGYDPQINSGGGLYVPINPQDAPPSIICSTTPIPSANVFADVVNNNVSFSNPWSQSRKWSSGYQAFLHMSRDTTMLNAGQVYQDFYDSLEVRPTGYLARAEICLSNNDTSGARAALNLVNCSDTVESTIYIAQEIYLNTFAKGIYLFDSIQTQLLTDISGLKLAQGGKGTLMARMMLNAGKGTANFFWIEAEDSIPVGNSSNKQFLTNSAEVKGIVRIFPNPAHEQLTIELPEAGMATVRIYSLSGQLIHQVDLKENALRYTVNVGHIPQGIYLCEIAINQTVHHQKLIIAVR